MGYGIKTRVEHWSEPTLEEAKDRLSEDDLKELFRDIQENDHFDEANEDEFEPGDRLQQAFENNDEEIYEDFFSDLREFARDEVRVNYQPDWAWSLLSFQPPEIEGDVLEVPSLGSHKGIMLTESGKRIGLYAKEGEERDIPTPVQHIERWGLNLNNIKSLGYEVASPEYDRAVISDEEAEEVSMENEPITMLTMDFNGEMVLGNHLMDYLKTFVSDDKTHEILSYFKDKRRESVVENLAEKDPEELGEMDKIRDEALRYHDLPGTDEKINYENDENSLFSLSVGHASGDIVSTGILEYSHNTGNFAYVLPENWHVGKVEPEDIYENTTLVVVDIGEYNDLMTDEMKEEDPFLSEQQKRELTVEDEEDYDFEPRIKGGSRGFKGCDIS